MGSDKLLLVGIGAQRSGTTWLGRYLAQHPQVFMSPIKELHHFDARLLPNLCSQQDRFALDRLKFLSDIQERTAEQEELRSASQSRVRMMVDETEYARYFLARAGARPVICEITPSYAMLDRQGFSRIRATFERVRFVFLMRNPIDRLWSHLRYSGLAESVFDDGGALSQIIADPHFNLRTDYRRTLTELFAVVPRRDVALEFFERLFSDSAIEKLCAFFGTDLIAGRYDRRANARPQIPMSTALRAVAYRAFAHVFVYVNDLFGGDIPPSWKQDMVAFA